MPETTQQRDSIAVVKAAMLEYVMPIILALLGFLGIQVLDEVKNLRTDNSNQDSRLTEVETTVNYLERELNRVRDKKEK